MVPTDDKQNRLSTLSQDVIAVTKKPASTPAVPPRPADRSPERVPERAPERPPEARKPIPPSQDVFKVPTQTPVTPPPAVSPSRVPVKPDAGTPAAVWAVGAVAVLALLVAAYAVMNAGVPAAGPDANAGAAVAKLEVDLKATNERIAKLEVKLDAAAADAQKLGAPGQGNVLQLSASIRELRDDIDRVSNGLAALQAQAGETRGLAGAAQKDARMALAQVEQLSGRVGSVSDQVAGAQRAAGQSGAAATADLQTQLKGLSQKTDKLVADVRQLYRLLEGQR